MLYLVPRAARAREIVGEFDARAVHHNRFPQVIRLSVRLKQDMELVPMFEPKVWFIGSRPTLVLFPIWRTSQVLVNSLVELEHAISIRECNRCYAGVLVIPVVAIAVQQGTLAFTDWCWLTCLWRDS